MQKVLEITSDIQEVESKYTVNIYILKLYYSKRHPAINLLTKTSYPNVWEQRPASVHPGDQALIKAWKEGKPATN